MPRRFSCCTDYGGHFALDTAADEIAALVGQFMKTQKETELVASQ
jgi:hypothetical protein